MHHRMNRAVSLQPGTKFCATGSRDNSSNEYGPDMKRRYKILIGFVSIVVMASTVVAWLIAVLSANLQVAWKADCAGCHGENLEGGQGGPALVGVLKHGDSTEQLIQSIGMGSPEQLWPVGKTSFLPNLSRPGAFRREHRQEFQPSRPLTRKFPKVLGPCALDTTPSW